MSKLILIGLVAVWAVVLAPDVLRRLGRGRRGDAVSSFSSRITSLGSMHRSTSLGSMHRFAKQDSEIMPPAQVQSVSPPARTASTAPRSPRTSAGSGQRGSGQGRSAAKAEIPANVVDIRSRARSVRPAAPQQARTAASPVRKRRQDVLAILGSAAILSLLATVAFGGIFLTIHLVVDVLLIAYLVMLAQVTTGFGSIAHQNPAPSRPVHSAPTARRPAGTMPVGTVSAAGTVSARTSPTEPQRIAN